MTNAITNSGYYCAQSTYVKSSYYYSNRTLGEGDFQSAVLEKDEDNSELANTAAKENETVKKGYTRIITASICNSDFAATQLSEGRTAYSYQGVMQQFQIRIDVVGETRTYTAIGTDENGDEFSKEIDPYNVDPTDSDFTEFAALCSYIRETEELADEAMKAVDSVAPYDIFEKKNYVSELSSSISNLQLTGVSTLGTEQFLSQINKLMETLMSSGIGSGVSHETSANATTFKGARIWGDTGCFWTLGSAQLRYQSVSFEGKIDTKSDESKEETAKEIVTPLRCLGTIPVGMNHSYIMTASEVIKEGSDEKIIRVHVGGKDVDVDVSKVDPKNATVIEMFAYCQYADANGTGTHDTFGSFHSMKLVTDPFGENSYSSIEEAMTKKQNWTDTISNSKTVATKYATNETIDASDLLKMLEETYKILLSLKSNKNKKGYTDEEWDELYQKLFGDSLIEI